MLIETQKRNYRKFVAEDLTELNSDSDFESDNESEYNIDSDSDQEIKDNYIKKLL